MPQLSQGTNQANKLRLSLDRGQSAVGPFSETFGLQQAAAAEDPGTWQAIPVHKKGSAQVFGTFVGTVEIRGSNELNPDSETNDGFLIGSVTAPGVVTWDYPVRNIKAKIPAYTSGQINVNAHVCA
jgi:hypothetical protein